MTDAERLVAIEEFKQLQTIIGRHEGQEYQVRGWLLVLLGGLVAALFSGDNSRLFVWAFLAVGCVLILAFFFMELMIRVPKRESIDRVASIERALRGEIAYDGPLICETLSGGPGTNPWRSIARAEVKVLGVWSFYIPVLAIVLIIATSAHVSRLSGSAQVENKQKSISQEASPVVPGPANGALVPQGAPAPRK
ncbi:hypothetical protein QTH97_08695 [Variovorax sp. J22R24]|uniref:hypothetical protein n=1 Tax=Variovorax gracilis TaxID=3053502 RepID=UPI0025775F74|nr:hypothetical protein [Variovorax sp. J22R24]MDM0105009.1 hypothetical protein [Variovorax sp. J22R24]